jgi:hypothetical protein
VFTTEQNLITLNLFNVTNLFSLKQWVMGSSKLSSLREPLLLLDFHLREGKNMMAQKSDIKQKTVSLELDKNELNKVLGVLEKAQEAMSNRQA